MSAHRVLSRKCALACLPSGKYRAAHSQCVDAKCGCFCGHPHLSSATASPAVQAVGDVIGADGSSPAATDPSSRSPVGP